MKVVLIIFAAVLFAVSLNGAKPDLVSIDAPQSIKALMIEPGEIQLDGSLGDRAWKSNHFAGNFVQRDPLEGEPATERTEFTVLYDPEYLYIGVKAYDSDPGNIRSILSRRDEKSPSDWVCISLDSYGDYRTAFEFWLNPEGVKRDIRWYDDMNQDINWDAVWEGKASRQADGWSAEFKIPFRELRFNGDDDQSWGLQVYRHISRKNEDDYWSFWPKDETGYVRHFGRLEDLKSIPRQRRIYVTPYTTGRYAVSPLYQNAVHPENFDLHRSLGADVKTGLGNNFTLDLTVNPDFGQVEADPAELNLTAFESFFPEKRPFFIEGSNIFFFNLGLGQNSFSNNTLFYSRRIGRSPHHSPDTEDYVDAPISTSIKTAGKLSGKTANGWSIGIIDAVTAEEQATIRSEDNGTSYEIVEPMTNYAVTRVQKDFRQGKTTVGGILTATNRQLDEEHLKFLHSDAYSGGLDVSHLFANDNYQIEASFAATRVTGSEDALFRTQTSAVHYFQRPNTKHLRLDSTATTLTGYSHKFAFSKVKGEHWRGALGEWTYSPGFEANDLGFNRNVDTWTRFLWIQYREDDPGEKIRRWSLNFNMWNGSTMANEMVNIGANINGGLTLLNYWRLSMGVYYNGPQLHTTALWGGPAMVQDAQSGMGIYVSSDQRKKLSIGMSGSTGGSQESGVNWLNLNSQFTWRPADFLSIRFSTQFNEMRDTWANWSDYEPVEDQQTGEKHYVMSELNRNTLSTTIRLDLTLSPTLSVQYYGSPFMTAGTYNNDKLVLLDNVLADRFEERFHTFSEKQIEYDDNSYTYDLDEDGITNIEMWNRDFNFKQFNSNLVIRWEYITGSSIYLVWSQGIEHSVENGDFTFGRDIRRLFNSDGENIFLIKFSYLLNL